MAIYIHYEATPPIGGMSFTPKTWVAAMGSAYTATASTITIFNTDGTRTVAHGSFLLLNGNLLAGVVSSLDRTSSDGEYPVREDHRHGDRCASLRRGDAGRQARPRSCRRRHDDRLLGDDLLNGYGGVDQMAGGKGNDVYVVKIRQ